MHTYQLLVPLEADGIDAVDIEEPKSSSPEFAKACAVLLNQFIYTQSKYMDSPRGKAAISQIDEKNKDKKEVEPTVFEMAAGVNMLYAMADPDFLVNMIEKFSAVYAKNPSIIKYNGENLKALPFKSLSHKDLSILATAYCFAFMQG